MSLLRERVEGAFDVSRQQAVLEATQEKLQTAEHRLTDLEGFIIQQVRGDAD